MALDPPRPPPPDLRHDQHVGAALQVYAADGLPGVPDPALLHPGPLPA